MKRKQKGNKVVTMLMIRGEPPSVKGLKIRLFGAFGPLRRRGVEADKMQQIFWGEFPWGREPRKRLLRSLAQDLTGEERQALSEGLPAGQA